jgi:hypothetical protein
MRRGLKFFILSPAFCFCLILFCSSIISGFSIEVTGKTVEGTLHTCVRGFDSQGVGYVQAYDYDLQIGTYQRDNCYVNGNFVATCTGSGCTQRVHACLDMNNDGITEAYNYSIKNCIGCSYGKCNTSEYNESSGPYVCTDSDGGKVYYTKGNVTYGNSLIPEQRSVVSDFCSGANIQEVFCFIDEEGEVSFGWGGIACPNGCKDGACLGTPPVACQEGYTICGNVCYNNANPCNILNGAGAQSGSCSNGVWKWNTCHAVSCNNGWLLKEGTCMPSKSIIVPCNLSDPNVQSCDGICFNNYRNCSVANGIGFQFGYCGCNDVDRVDGRCSKYNIWSWYVCHASACNEGYFLGDGGCVSTKGIEVLCKDSDKGIDTFTKGTITSTNLATGVIEDDADSCYNLRQNIGLTSSCEAGTYCYLHEYHCNVINRRLTSALILMPCYNGCKDGACIPDSKNEILSNCTDSDGGMNYYIKGNSTDSIKTLIEGCVDSSNNVREFFCGEDGKIYSEDYDCPNGCKEGACIKTNSTNQTYETCIDSDGGLNYYIYGIVSLKDSLTQQASSMIDYCGDSNYLMEAYCPPTGIGVVKNEKHFCPNGCKEGACLLIQNQTIPACIDSDGGLNYNVRGDVRVNNGEALDILIDSCENQGILNEVYCGGDITKTLTYDCTIENRTCLNGACIEKNESIFYCESGCAFNKKCYPFGYRKTAQYCSEEYIFIKQLDTEGICENNFECKSNLCIDSQCISQGVMQKFFHWLKNSFNRDKK